MREIKFRGWRPSTKEWVYGYLIEREQTKYDQIVQPTDRLGLIVYDVEKETVGQFTGLYDVANEEIYTGQSVYVPKYDHVGRVFINVHHGVVIEGLCMSVKVSGQKGIQAL